MVFLTATASITAVLTGIGSGAPDNRDAVVRTLNNGEFISRYYPPESLKRGEQGRVAFRLTIEPDGSIGSCDVTESSGFAALDQSTCEILVSNARVKPVRNAEGRSIRADQGGYIVWRLPERSTVLAESTAKTMPKPERLICKRSQTTGSLISKTKQCMTRSDWARTEKVWRQEVEELIRLEGGCKSSGIAC